MTNQTQVQVQVQVQDFVDTPPVSGLMAVRIWAEIMTWLVAKGRYTDCAAIQMWMKTVAEGGTLELHELEHMKQVAAEFREWKEGETRG